MVKSDHEVELRFSQPIRQVLLMLSVLVLTSLGTVVAAPRVMAVFTANLWLNGFILFVFFEHIVLFLQSFPTMREPFIKVARFLFHHTIRHMPLYGNERLEKPSFRTFIKFVRVASWRTRIATTYDSFPPWMRGLKTFPRHPSIRNRGSLYHCALTHTHGMQARAFAVQSFVSPKISAIQVDTMYKDVYFTTSTIAYRSSLADCTLIFSRGGSGTHLWVISAHR